jgi:nicotinate phosphoribosyltransferase
MMERLPVATFDLPAAELRRGYRSAIYFSRAGLIAEAHPDRDRAGVLMQVFQKHRSILCGIDEALAVLRVGTGRWRDRSRAERLFDELLEAKFAARGAGRDNRRAAVARTVELEDELDELWRNEWPDLSVSALHDGDGIEPWETVAHIEGPYSSFAHLESVYLGVLARRTLIATNTRRVVEAAAGKPVLFFADRFDHWSTQGGDGYAAHVGGATSVASDAMAAWWGERGMGTMPHSLIAFFGGDTVAATAAFEERFPTTDLIALVDFDNDCATTALACAERFGERLWGVRLDTSQTLVDRCFDRDSPNPCPRPLGDFVPTGVNPVLVEHVRATLDAAGHADVRLIVSGGFDPQRILAFEAAGVPVDAYAVGSSLLRGENDFTADVVRPAAKEGRWFRANPRLELEPV